MMKGKRFIVVFFCQVYFLLLLFFAPNFQYLIQFKFSFLQPIYIVIMKTIILICSLLYILNSQVTAPAAIAQFGSKDQSLFNLPSQIQNAQQQTRINSNPNLRSKIIPVPPPSCYTFHWIFALDESGSMNQTKWGKLQWILWWFKWWLGNWDPWCSQYMTAYTFDTRATLPPSKYFEKVSPNTFDPLAIARNGGQTNFGQPLVRGLEFILLHRNLDTCFIMITDGQALQPSVEVDLFNMVRNYMDNKNKQVCVLCYHIRSNDNDSPPSSFVNMCNELQGDSFSYRETTFETDLPKSLKRQSIAYLQTRHAPPPSVQFVRTTNYQREIILKEALQKFRLP